MLDGPAFPQTRRCPEAIGWLRAVHAGWARQGRSLLDEISGDFAPWTHYPAEPRHGAAGPLDYFYHRHAETAGPEHGHFHVFMSPAGIPPGLTPLILPELAVGWPSCAIADRPADGRGALVASHVAPGSALCHLVGIGLGHDGAPIRLFTANRWVTGETWYAAPDLVAMLDRLVLYGGSPVDPGPVDQWLLAMLRAFRAEIAALVLERDAAIAAWRLRRRSGLAHEDRRLVTPSSRAIHLQAEEASGNAVPHPGRVRIPAAPWRERPATL